MKTETRSQERNKTHSEIFLPYYVQYHSFAVKANLSSVIYAASFLK
jgi:hypothetical protein